MYDMILLSTVLLLFLVNRDSGAEIQVEESVTREFTSSCDPKDTSIFQRLLGANLEHHGYTKVTKEVVTKIVATADHEPIRHVSLFFHKKTACNGSLEVERELDYYFAGLLSFELVERLAVEMESRHFVQIRFCHIGIEVHFQQNSHRAPLRSRWKSFFFSPRRRESPNLHGRNKTSPQPDAGARTTPPHRRRQRLPGRSGIPKSTPPPRRHRTTLPIKTIPPQPDAGNETFPPRRLHRGATNQPFGGFKARLDKMDTFSCRDISIKVVAEIKQKVY